MSRLKKNSGRRLDECQQYVARARRRLEKAQSAVAEAQRLAQTLQEQLDVGLAELDAAFRNRETTHQSWQTFVGRCNN